MLDKVLDRASTVGPSTTDKASKEGRGAVRFFVEGDGSQFIQKMRRRLPGFLVRSACFDGHRG